MEIQPDGRLSKLVKKVIPEPLLSATLSSGSNPGDNMIGKMLTIQLETVSGRKETLILKGLLPYGNTDVVFTHADKMMAKVMTMFKVFSTEIGFYQRIGPELDRHFGLTLPSPKFFYGLADEENDGAEACIVMEDLRAKGFRMADKMGGLTHEELYLVLEKIARFHAASFVYLQTHQKKLVEQLQSDPDKVTDPLAHHVFAKSGESMKDEHTVFTEQLYFGLINHAKDINVISGELHGKISKLTSDPRQKVIDVSKQAAREYFHTVIHGDLWVNNILFKYDAVEPKKPVDICFIDFQQCRYSSVFDELHYFIYTSTTADFRKKNLEQCLDFYYDVFINTLNKLGGPNTPRPTGFSREEFHKGYRKFLSSAFVYAVIAIPFQAGIAPAEETNGVVNGEETEAPKSEGGGADKQPTSNEIKNFVGEMFQHIGTGLVAAAKNSPVAISRFTELAEEMNELGVFD